MLPFVWATRIDGQRVSNPVQSEPGIAIGFRTIRFDKHPSHAIRASHRKFHGKLVAASTATAPVSGSSGLSGKEADDSLDL